MPTDVSSGPFEPIDFDRFHKRDLPARLAEGNGRLARADLDDVPPLAFRTTGGASYTYLPSDSGVDVVPGTERASTIAELTPALWSDFAHELRTVPGLFYGGELSIPSGDFGELLRWEPPLRAMYHGRPVYDPEAVPLRDASGLPLDLERHFTLGDRDEDLRDFLDRTGFAVVRGVFSAQEIAELRTAVDELTSEAEPGDKRSWWATTQGGEQVLCRLIYAGQRSERIGALNGDPRVRRLGALAGQHLVACPDRMDGHAVIIKQPRVAAGLSDLPWHVDCGLGGHSVFCPVLQLSIYLEDATAETGLLKMLAGSWRSACHIPAPEEEAHLPVVSCTVAPGDCSLHYGDTMHAAPPPTGAGMCRRSIVMSFFQPRLLDIIDPGRSFNDLIIEHTGGNPRGS